MHQLERLTLQDGSLSPRSALRSSEISVRTAAAVYLTRTGGLEFSEAEYCPTSHLSLLQLIYFISHRRFSLPVPSNMTVN